MLCSKTGMSRDEIEVADRAAAEQSTDLQNVFASMRMKTGQYLRISRLRERRNLSQHGVAQKAGSALNGVIERRSRIWDDTVSGKQPQNLPKSSVRSNRGHC